MSDVTDAMRRVRGHGQAARPPDLTLLLPVMAPTDSFEIAITMETMTGLKRGRIVDHVEAAVLDEPGAPVEQIRLLGAPDLPAAR